MDVICVKVLKIKGDMGIIEKNMLFSDEFLIL